MEVAQGVLYAELWLRVVHVAQLHSQPGPGKVDGPGAPIPSPVTKFQEISAPAEDGEGLQHGRQCRVSFMRL